MSLTRLDLPAVYRAGAELAEAVHAHLPDDYPQDLADADRVVWSDAMRRRSQDPAALDCDDYCLAEQRLSAWHKTLDRITDAANRLKRALGATGGLGGRSRWLDGPPLWPLRAGRFNDADHPRLVRQGLLRLACAAIDLSGYAEDRTTPDDWRCRGLRLLAEGMTGVWDGMTAAERSSVCDVGPGRGRKTGRPPVGGGLGDYDPVVDPRCIDEANGFYTRDAAEHLQAVEKSMRYQTLLQQVPAASVADLTQRPQGRNGDVRTIQRHGERSYSLDGASPIAVSPAVDAILQAFAKAGRSLTTSQVESESGYENAVSKYMRKIETIFPGAVRFPGKEKKGQGYYVRVRDLTPGTP